MRYLKEIEGISKLVANDFDTTAVELINKNFEFNSIPKEKTEGKTFVVNFSDM